VLETLTETTRPVEGASCKFVRHWSMDAVDRKMRVDGRNELRRQRQRQARAKARAAKAAEAAASTADEVLQHRASRESL
jgi:site-specific DNA-methyltransferase